MSVKKTPRARRGTEGTPRTIQVVGIGAGGHAKVLIEALRLLGRYEVVGLLDPNRELWETRILDIPVLGDDTQLSVLRDRGLQHAFIGVGSVGDPRIRRRLYERARSSGFEIVRIIHPAAWIAPSSMLGHGLAVMARAVINAATKVGDNVIVNTGAIIEHDCLIGDHVHIATGALLAGTVTVEEGAHVGLGAVIRQGVRIGRGAIVGAGAVVAEDVPEGVVVAGVPARVLKQVDH